MRRWLNVSNRYGAWHFGGQKMLAINNVELISDRPLELNLRGNRRGCGAGVAGPQALVIVSAMVELEAGKVWHDHQENSRLPAPIDRTELRLPARHERAAEWAVRSGQVLEYCGADYRLGDASGENSGDRKVDAQDLEHW